MQVRAQIFRGTDHKNLTTLIETDQAAVVGAPYLVLVDDGAVILANFIN